MKCGVTSVGVSLCLVWAGLACGQTQPASADIEVAALELSMPDRYQLAPVLEPARKVTLVAPRDGLVRSVSVPLGAVVRDAQEVAELDRGEAAARLKIALAELKEKRAIARRASQDEAAQAQVEAAQARAELAQLELDHCTLRAPFAGRVLAIPVSAGQFVVKGTPIVEIADVTTLRALHPVDRRTTIKGASINIQVEDKEVAAKVQSVVPLPDSFLVLRSLALPYAAAWLVVPNPKGDLEPGLRTRPATIPTAPITVVAKRALRKETGHNGDDSVVQVLRGQFVTNIPIHVLGDVGPDRLQVTGPFFESDMLIVGSSLNLLPGTLVPGFARGKGATAEPRSPAQSGNHPAGPRLPPPAAGESSAPY